MAPNKKLPRFPLGMKLADIKYPMNITKIIGKLHHP
jgi:hypothetical protein